MLGKRSMYTHTPRLSLYFHTLRHLQVRQIVTRLLYLLLRPYPSLAPAPLKRSISGKWVLPARRERNLLSPWNIRLLNDVRIIESPEIWNHSSLPKLWLYNLHYFDDLVAREHESRTPWHAELIRRWINENPPGNGVGWEAYPISRRLVNWIKWDLETGELTDAARESIAVQVRYLCKRIEKHHLDNHLIANAKALVFAGLYFEGPEADRWLSKGLGILRRELPKQILPDGGHFELSPMYHCLVLEDLLDLLNVAKAYRQSMIGPYEAPVREWEAAAAQMRKWLIGICHPDGEIALFNDAAFGMAPRPDELEEYANRLGVTKPAISRDKVVHFPESGYIRIQWGNAVLLLDVARVGPDENPGHGHADTLTFELSLHAQRLIVDTGVSRYESGPVRSYERGTRAHNTVVVDGADSSEVWDSFRVARRARPFGLKIERKETEVTVECSHDGYRRLPGCVIHHRRWTLHSGGIKIEDEIEGHFKYAQTSFLLHPLVARRSKEGIGCNSEMRAGEWLLDRGEVVHWRITEGTGKYEYTSYHPEFGTSHNTVRLVLEPNGSRMALEISWKGEQL